MSDASATRAENVLLFSYGSLRNRHVQIATFARELAGRADALPGYTRRFVPNDDPAFIKLSGETELANLEPSPDPDAAVAGVVFEITQGELGAADEYEALAGYRRIRVTLQSGDEAWVYVRV